MHSYFERLIYLLIYSVTQKGSLNLISMRIKRNRNQYDIVTHRYKCRMILLHCNHTVCSIGQLHVCFLEGKYRVFKT